VPPVTTATRPVRSKRLSRFEDVSDKPESSFAHAHGPDRNPGV
jgi:hypothetical protein